LFCNDGIVALIISLTIRKIMPLKKLLIVALLSIALVAGCGGPRLPDGMPTLYPVTITVTQDGSPLDDAVVMLSGTEQWISTGRTDARGNAVLYTQSFYTGVPEGTFSVTVTKIAEEGERPPRRPFDPESARIYAEYQRSGQTFRQFNTVPARYREAETTPLTVEIQRGVRNVTVNVEGTVREEIRQR